MGRRVNAHRSDLSLTTPDLPAKLFSLHVSKSAAISVALCTTAISAPSIAASTSAHASALRMAVTASPTTVQSLLSSQTSHPLRRCAHSSRLLERPSERSAGRGPVREVECESASFSQGRCNCAQAARVMRMQ